MRYRALQVCSLPTEYLNEDFVEEEKPSTAVADIVVECISNISIGYQSSDTLLMRNSSSFELAGKPMAPCLPFGFGMTRQPGAVEVQSWGRRGAARGTVTPERMRVAGLGWPRGGWANIGQNIGRHIVM